MKKLLYISVFFTLAACSRSNFTLDMTIANGDYNDRQAYLLGYYDGNSVMWLDSAKIINNHVKFRAHLPHKEMLCEVIVAECPISFRQFRFSPKEHAAFVFDPNMQTLYPHVEGSAASEEVEIYWSDISSCFRRQRELRKELRKTDRSDDQHKAIERQIKCLSDSIRLRSNKLFSETKSLLNAYLAYATLCDHLPVDSLAILKQQMLQRWSDDVNRSILTGISTVTGDSIGEANDQTKALLNRRAVLLGDLPPYPKEQHAPMNSTDVETYVIGSTVSDFSLPDRSNNEIALSDLYEPYVLIDFWASWCGPCREEMPKLLSAAKDYEGIFAVYAVSIDENLNRWKHAVDNDDENALFKHVLLRRDNPSYEQLFHQFGIETIPHNFLLDKNRRIIAIDLRGEELQKTLKQLLSEE